MGSLPASRVTPNPPFTNTGLDFCGPFDVRTSKYGKTKTTFKCYVAIFICMCTKAIHIELTSDLTYEAFRAAYSRFTARRGTPHTIHSDNGTTFVKTARMLLQDWEVAKNNAITDLSLQHSKDDVKTKWIFIPPYAPNFGGLWEAAVKSTKFHLKRILVHPNLTYEEFATILHQVECIVNSRPIAPLSESPDDYTYLTPSHFLIGRKIIAPIEPQSNEEKLLPTKRWQLVKKLYQDFWKSWSNDFLNKLQTRKKWKTETSNLKEGTLVLIKNDLLPPAKWQLARIHELHSGKDGLVRVVSLRTPWGTIEKRALSKIIPLFLESSEN
jgi:hypothetical protein